MVLRSAIDWQTIYYDKPVTQSIYDSLSGGANLRLDGRTVAMEARDGSRFQVLHGGGWSLRMKNPSVAPSKHDQSHPVVVEAQGTAWAGGVDLESALDDLERYLWDDGNEYTPDDRIPGRVDLAVDVWLQDTAKYSGEDLYNAIICGASALNVRDNWARRSRRKEMGAEVRFLGHGGEGPITMYLGSRSGGLQLKVYRKDVDFKGNTREHVEDSWREQGWDDSGAVARFEFMLSREFLRKTDFGGIPGNKIKLGDLRRHLPDLWETCLTRVRWTPDCGAQTDRGTRRASAPLWDELRRHPPVPSPTGTGRVLTFSEREHDVEELRKRTMRTLVSYQEAAGLGRSQSLAETTLSGAVARGRGVSKQIPLAGIHGNEGGRR